MEQIILQYLSGLADTGTLVLAYFIWQVYKEIHEIRIRLTRLETWREDQRLYGQEPWPGK